MGDLLQNVDRSLWSFPRAQEITAERSAGKSSIKGRFWIVADVATIVFAAAVAVVYTFHTSPVAEVKGLWADTLIHGRSMGVLLALLCVFSFALIMTSRRLHLYTPIRLNSFLHEQRLSVQACVYSGLLLTGTIYLIHAEDISRELVLITIGLVTVSLSLRRLAYRLLIYRCFERGEGTRNVLIVGTGPEAQALGHQLESIRHLGYTFKGFIDFPGPGSRFAACSEDVLGTIDTLFQNARKYFVDEIFFATPCEREIIQEVLDRARINGVDLRVVPDMYDGLAWNSPIEYIGQFPTIPLHCGHMPEMGLLLKRGMDIVLAGLTLFTLSPLLLVIALAVKLESPGPVLFISKRIGKKGLVFRCIKFRTMVRDADKRRAGVQHVNERDGVVFKIASDPRNTRLGRLLRKYSLDVLPQFINVLRGDMSIVGPRPPLANEVREYKLSHLRRFDVMPGITGLWQVQARQGSSFDNHISLDVTYVDNWSIWLDAKILVRAIWLILTGKGS